jgi:hypothetical protein
MINLCEKLVNFSVKISVYIYSLPKTLCKSTYFSTNFNTFSHQVFNIFPIDNHLYTFSQIHRPYYHYYDIFINNNINNRKV